MPIERRSFTIQGLTRSDDGKICGHAATFNKLSRNLGGFREQIAEVAFDRALAENQDVRALWNHDTNFVLGRTKSGTLSLRKDEKGLAFEITPPDTQCARDLQVSLDRGDIDEMSFGFTIKKDNWEERDGEIVRTLIDVDLFDVSPVTFAAYEGTDVGLRSLDEQPEHIKAKVAEMRAKQESANEDAGAASADSGDWETSQERMQLMTQRVDLAEKI